MLSKLKFRVRRWHSAMRGWDEQDVRVIVECETHTWYWVIMEWLLWDVQTYLCHYLHYIPLPGFIMNWERHWDADDPTYFGKFGDWFGGDLGSLWHIYVCDPCLQFVWKHKDQDGGGTSFEMTLDEAREKFAHDPPIYEWVEREIERHKRWDAEKITEIKAQYRSSQLTREEAIDKLSFVRDIDNDQLSRMLDE